MRLLPVAVQRVLLLFLAAAVVLVGHTPTAALGATVAEPASGYDYDGPAIARVDAREASALEPALPQLSDLGDQSEPPAVERRRAPTTRSSQSSATEAVDANVVMGRKGSEMLVESGTNVPGIVNGRAYSAHAFDQMQGRGIMPSVVDDTIATGVPAASRGATTVYYGAGNNISVVVNAEGKVVTVSYGDLRP